MTQEPILGTAILGTNQLQPVKWEGVAYWSSVGISGNIPRFVYVDLIGKTIQVILELCIISIMTITVCSLGLEHRSTDRKLFVRIQLQAFVFPFCKFSLAFCFWQVDKAHHVN